MSVRFLAMCCLLALLLAAGPASALQVEEVRWGFDGRAVPERINLLSLLLANNTATPCEGMVSIHKETSGGQRLGADLAQTCFVGPFSSRWVQFYPYVAHTEERWLFVAGTQRVELPSPALGQPAVVRLSAEGEAFGRAARAKAFPENLFPATVAATDGLAAVMLDHVPRWEQGKREAFMDWLRRGGTVHVGAGEGGRHPEFTAELSALNGPQERMQVGAGLVVRYPAGKGPEAASEAPTEESRRSSWSWKFEDAVFRGLRGLVTPAHDWALIYSTLVAYVLLVGPFNYLLGRRSKGFLVPTAFFMASVVGFAFVLSALGRRGYGESAAVHTLSYARPVGAQQYDVTQWANAFAVRGARYVITHPGSHSLYETCQDYEAVNGTVLSGIGGKFVVDIPLYSSCSFLHRGKMEGPELGLRILQWDTQGTRQNLVLATGPGFPEGELEAWALQGDKFYRLNRREDGSLTTGGSRGIALDSFLPEDSYATSYAGFGGGVGLPGERKAKAAEVWQAMLRPLIGRAVGLAEVPELPVKAPPPADCVQVFIFASGPEGFCLAGKGLGRETGYVLYHMCLFRPGGEDASDR